MDNAIDKDLIFFSEEGRGLTSTLANHIANMAKEMIRGLMAELEELQFDTGNMDNGYFSMQKLYREALSEVNVRKHKCSKAAS